MAASDELQASVDRHLGLLAESIRQDRQMLAYIDEQLEPLLRARRYAKVALAVLVSGGLWILALLTEPLLLIFATPLLPITLGLCPIALSPKRPDDDFAAASMNPTCNGYHRARRPLAVTFPSWTATRGPRCASTCDSMKATACPASPRRPASSCSRPTVTASRVTGTPRS